MPDRIEAARRALSRYRNVHQRPGYDSQWDKPAAWDAFRRACGELTPEDVVSLLDAVERVEAAERLLGELGEEASDG